MAGFNEILAGRYNRAFQKLLSMKGPAAVTTLSGEIGPTFPLFWGTEMRYLEAWNLYASIAALSAPGVGNRVGQRLRNPAGSNIVAVVQKISYGNQSASVDGPFLTFQTTNSDLNVAAGAPRALDSRSKANSSMITSVQNNAAADAATIWGSQMTANTQLDVILFEDQEIPILPGDALSMYSGLTNSAAQISFWWRERMLEDSEKT